MIKNSGFEGSCRTVVLFHSVFFTLIISVGCYGHAIESTDIKPVEDSINHSLDEVLVTARAVSLTPQRTIGRDQLETMPSNSVADALKYMAGVQIKDYGGLGGQKTINVRSLGSQHVGVYLDGVRITNVQNGTVDLGKYSLSTLESVSLFNANKADALMTASEYASASTVYLRTRQPEKTSVTLSQGVGSFNTYKTDLNLSFKRYGFIDANFTHSKGDYPFEYHTQYEDTAGVRRNSDITSFRVECCGFYRGFNIHAYYFNSRRGLPGGVVRRLSDRYTDVGREWDRNFFTQVGYNGNIKNVRIRGVLKYADDYLHYRSDYPENISVHSNNRYRQQDLYSALAGCYGYRDFSFSLSTDFRWSDLMTDVRNFSYVYRIDSKVSAALFYARNDLNISVSGLYTDVSDHTRRQATPLRKFTWTVMGGYHFGDVSVRAFYKSVFRTPTLNDLYYTLVGNRNLRPEYTRQLNVGLTYRHGILDVQFDSYLNRVMDRIVCLPLKGSYQWTMMNYGLTRCLGVDLSATVTFPHSSLLVSGTFQDDRNRTDPDESSYNDLIAYSPRWSLTAVYSANYKGFYGALSHMYVGKRYWTAENEIEPPLSAYNCTDVKVGWNFRRMLTLEVECQDLFDVRYELIQRWPMPGRRFLASVKISM